VRGCRKKFVEVQEEVALLVRRGSMVVGQMALEMS